MTSVRKGNMYFFMIFLLLTVGANLVGYIGTDNGTITAVSEVLFLLIPALAIGLAKGDMKERFMFNRISIKEFIMLIIIGILAIRAVLSINIISMEFFHNFLDDALGKMGTRSLIEWILILAVTPAVCEEIVMRGVVLSEYRNVSVRKAAVVNGLLFGLFHLNINQFLYAFFLGVVMVYIVVITKSIFSSMFIHFMLNGTSAVLFWATNKYPELLKIQEASAGSISTNGLIIEVLLGITCIGIIAFIIRGAMIRKGQVSSMSIGKIIGEEDNRDEALDLKKERIFDVWILLTILIFLFYTFMLFMVYGYI